MKKFYLIFILTLLSLPSFSSAQVGAGGPVIGTLADELTVKLLPTYPRPNEETSVLLEMYTEDLNSANIGYYIDGRLTQSSKGLKEFSFKAPRAGQSVDLSISISLQRGPSFNKNLTITPASVEILYEALSYTPPFYKGKALFAPQGLLKILALPHFSASSNSLNNNSSLVYKWTVDGVVRPELGGYGKNTATIKDSILGKGLKIQVLATNPATNVTAAGFLEVAPYDPQLIFYENSPLYGLTFERSLNNSISLQNDETNIFAIPYNMSLEDLDNVKYSWRINGQSADNISGRSAIFRKPEGVTGSSNISLEVENPSKPLQLGESSFNINFLK